MSGGSNEREMSEMRDRLRMGERDMSGGSNEREMSEMRDRLRVGETCEVIEMKER